MNHGTPMTGGQGPGVERILGRYALFDEIAAGGMATVHLGRLIGPVGFSKTVAIKRLHANLARDPEFVSMFLDEARLAARIQHPNVVATLDVVAADGEVFLVLDYVQGESFSHLLKATRIKSVPVAPRIVASIMVNALHGLHAAHEAMDEHGRPLGIVHRDVSPQNILVGADGVARVLDFGVAKAAGRLQNTRDGQLKGKLAYMAPEQIRGEEIDRRTDVYSAAVVLWEALVGRRLVHGLNEGQVLAAVLAGNFPAPSSIIREIPPHVDAIIMRGIAMSPAERWPTARELAIAIERSIGVASPFEVAEWVQAVGAEALSMRAARVREMESTSAVRVSLHDEGEPQVFHDARRRYDASRSGVTSPSGVSRPRPPVAGPVEGTGSVLVHPSVSMGSSGEASYPSASVAQPMPSSPVYGITRPPAGYATVPPALRATPSRAASSAKMAMIGVALSLFFGLSVLTLLLVWRAHTKTAAEITAPSARAEPVASPVASAAVVVPEAPPAVVDVPPVAVNSSEPAPPEPKKPAKPTKAPPSSPNPKPAKGCDSPFYVDQSGIKHIKPECM